MASYLFTEEQEKYIRDNCKGISVEKLKNKVNETFNADFTFKQIKGYLGRNALTNGLAGKHKSNGWFEKISSPIGTEAEWKRGTYVKVADNPPSWVRKTRIMYEKYHGILPDAHIVLQANGDMNDFSEENLVAIEKKIMLTINQNDLLFDNSELTKTGINVAKLINKSYEVKKG